MGGVGFGVRMDKLCRMEGEVLNFVVGSSLPLSSAIECRLRLESAFDSFCIASEAFSERSRRRVISAKVDQRRFL